MNNIREFRLKKGLSQQQLADLIGVNYSVVSKYEKGTVTPPEDRLILIADALGVTPEDLDPAYVTKKTRLKNDIVYLVGSEEVLIETQIPDSAAAQQRLTGFITRFNNYISQKKEQDTPKPLLDYTEKLLAEKSYKYIPENLFAIRKAKKISMSELADKVNVHRTYISRIEKGLIKPSPLLIIKLADAVDLTVDQLISDKLFQPIPWEITGSKLALSALTHLRQIVPSLSPPENYPPGIFLDLEDPCFSKGCSLDADGRERYFAIETPDLFFLNAYSEENKSTLFPIIVEHAIGKFVLSEDRDLSNAELIIALPLQFYEESLFETLIAKQFHTPFRISLWIINVDTCKVIHELMLHPGLDKK